MEPDANSTNYLDQLQAWINNYQSPVGQIDTSFDGWLSDKYEKPVIIQSAPRPALQPKEVANSSIQGFWLWFLVALGILAIIVAFWYVRSKKG